MYRLIVASVLTCALLSFNLPISRAGNRPLAVQVTVICPDHSVGQQFLSALKRDLKSDGYVHGKPWPMVRLFIYAAPTVNNRKNPGGWSIAVAHLDFEPLLAAAFHLLKGKRHVAPSGKSGQLFNILVHSQGTLTYLGVINIDHLDKAKTVLLAGNIINTFSRKWPPRGPNGPKPKLLPQLHGGTPGARMHSTL